KVIHAMPPVVIAGDLAEVNAIASQARRWQRQIVVLEQEVHLVRRAIRHAGAKCGEYLVQIEHPRTLPVARAEGSSLLTHRRAVHRSHAGSTRERKRLATAV